MVMTMTTGIVNKLTRRSLLLGSQPALLGLPGLLTSLSLGTTRSAHAMTEGELEFPRDHGAHPDFRTEWWYITGQAFKAGKGADVAGEPDFGFQLTFFRSRVESTQGMVSNFAAKQLIFAHAAITDVKGKKLVSDQRIARTSDSVLDLANASKRTTAVELRDWSLKRTPVKHKTDPDAPEGSLYQAMLPGRDVSILMQFRSTQQRLLQGNKGVSRKGPEATQTSYYYSQPQMSAQGTLSLQGQTHEVKGTAWLDHEWSEELLHPEAVGWDWIGMNLDDGSALTAYRLRNKDGKVLWDGGSFRTPAQAKEAKTYAFSQGEVVFRPLRYWKSPLSQATYPIEWLVRTPADFYSVRALVDNQELDSRLSTGAVYWEGLCELLDSKGRRVGRGYLEMTGYAGALRM
jgi:predicted secreted hydrolase